MIGHFYCSSPLGLTSPKPKPRIVYQSGNWTINARTYCRLPPLLFVQKWASDLLNKSHQVCTLQTSLHLAWEMCLFCFISPHFAVNCDFWGTGAAQLLSSSFKGLSFKSEEAKCLLIGKKPQDYFFKWRYMRHGEKNISFGINQKWIPISVP